MDDRRLLDNDGLQVSCHFRVIMLTNTDGATICDCYIWAEIV